MTFDALVGMVGQLPWFDLAAVVQLAGERRQHVTNQLHRLSKAGKIVRLRRGMYVLAERYRRTAVQPAELAGVIYRPSYLSCAWALSYYGLIPESVHVFTCVTSRSPRRFDNEFGEFRYRNVKQSLFFGAAPVQIGGRKVMVASPEKALVDLFYLTSGSWTAAQMRAMRFAPSELVNPGTVRAIVDAIGKPRLRHAYDLWDATMAEESAGEVQL